MTKIPESYELIGYLNEWIGTDCYAHKLYKDTRTDKLYGQACYGNVADPKPENQPLFEVKHNRGKYGTWQAVMCTYLTPDMVNDWFEFKAKYPEGIHEQSVFGHVYRTKCEYHKREDSTEYFMQYSITKTNKMEKKFHVLADHISEEPHDYRDPSF